MQLSIGGILVGRAIQAVSAAYLTRIAGKSFIEYFRHNQDWGDGGMTEVVQRQFQLNRKDEFVRSFVQDAISRVVKPLHLDEPEILDEEEQYGAQFQPKLEPIEVKQLFDEWEQSQLVADDWEN